MSVDWEKVKTEYITSKISYRELAEKHGVNRSTVCERGKKENWVAERDRFRAETVSKSVEKAQEKAVNYRSEIYSLAQGIVKQLESLTSKYSLERLIKMGVKPKDITGAIKDLEDALHIKSVEDINEQKARIRKLKKDIEGTDKGPKKVEIVISGGEESWMQ